MLKITSREDESRVVLELEGKLAGRWVAELAEAWHRACGARAGEAIAIDLADVTYVDRSGQELLTILCRAGARLSGTGCLTNSIVEDITRRAHGNERAEASPGPLVLAPAHERRHP
jgi:anti-anti-sigma regulatory factor